MQWRRSVPFVALLVFVSVTAVRAQAPEREPRVWSEAPLPTEAMHQVQKRDNLHLLAAYYYGDARQWVRIFQTNRNLIKDRNLLEPGQMLRVVLSPGWTPLEPYDQWKSRVEKLLPSLLAPSSQAPEESPAPSKQEGRLEGAFGEPTAGTAEGGDSPQDVFRRAKVAADHDDMHAFFQLISPDSRAVMGYTMVTGANTAISMKAAMEGGDGSAAQKQLDTLLQKHGVKEYPKEGPPINQADQDAVAAVAREMFSGVDVIALIEDLQAFMAQLGFEGGSSKITGGIEGELANLKIEGNRATATVGGKPGTFVRVNGRWYMEPELKG